jgi:hypothetical protein
MELLNGKAKELFEKWVFKTYPKYAQSYHNGCLSIFTDLTEQMTNALIIEWFDSVGVYIELGGINFDGLQFWYNIQEYNTINGINGHKFNTRQEATTQAIKKANELINQTL